jgi:hypothetical protein
MLMPALLKTVSIVDNLRIRYLPPSGLISRLGYAMKSTFTRNACLGIALAIAGSTGVAQAQLTGQTTPTTQTTGNTSTKLPGSFGGPGVTGQSRIDYSGKDPSTAFNNGQSVSGSTGTSTGGTGLAGQAVGNQFGANAFSNATGTGAGANGGLGNVGLGGGFNRGGLGGLGGLGGGGGMGNSTAAAKKLIRPIIRPDIEVVRENSTTIATNAAQRLTRIQMPKRLQGVRTSAEDGVVVLRGQVATESDKRMVERLVKLEPGIDSVRNEVIVLTNPVERIQAKPIR